MSLSEKIEQIRRQPESVRLRYVWLCVSVSMFFVFVIWILSLQTTFPKIIPPQPTPQTDTATTSANASEPSLQEMLQKSGSAEK